MRKKKLVNAIFVNNYRNIYSKLINFTRPFKDATFRSTFKRIKKCMLNVDESKTGCIAAYAMVTFPLQVLLFVIVGWIETVRERAD